MKFSILACGLLAAMVDATALTYKLGASEKACFYSNVEHKGAKVAFYFAVSGMIWFLGVLIFASGGRGVGC